MISFNSLFVCTTYRTSDNFLRELRTSTSFCKFLRYDISQIFAKRITSKSGFLKRLPGGSGATPQAFSIHWRCLLNRKPHNFCLHLPASDVSLHLSACLCLPISSYHLFIYTRYKIQTGGISPKSGNTSTVTKTQETQETATRRHHSNRSRSSATASEELPVMAATHCHQIRLLT